ncbi:hypothetical protein V5799_008258 [Amblyomma americanum]|uniref:Uncharacterized protein n=1 Tax=Amblyomma americanum TaxID=6943 RepID=A0AAQ4FDT0_AMBAM
MFASPIVIIGKVIYDSSSASPPLRPLSDFNLTEYMFRISVAGASSFAFFILLDAFGALALIYWYRDCDPLLAGAIRSHDQGAAWTCLLICAVQLWHGIGSGLSGFGRSPVITGTLDRCPVPANGTKGAVGIDAAVGEPLQRSPYVFPLYLVSYFWIAFFGFLFTIVLATALSLATGGAQSAKDELHLTSPLFLKLWRRSKFLRMVLKADQETKETGSRKTAYEWNDDEHAPLGVELTTRCQNTDA